MQSATRENGLHIACKNSQTTVAIFLIEIGFPVDEKDADNMTALHYAASRGLLWVVDRLVKKASIDELDCMDSTPLMHAASNGHLEVFDLLVQNGASLVSLDGLGSSCLAKACGNGHLEIAKRCLQLGMPVHSLDIHHQSPLWKAAQHGNIQLVRLLLCGGASVYTKDRARYTPLHIASMEQNAPILEILCEWGAAIDEFCDHTSPLQLIRSSAECAHILLSFGSKSVHSLDINRVHSQVDATLGRGIWTMQGNLSYRHLVRRMSLVALV